MITELIELEPIIKLTRDIKKAAERLNPREIRFLVDTYYQMQDDRMRSASQVRSMLKNEEDEPHELISWLYSNFATLERSLKSALGTYSQVYPVGRWAESNVGVGPVLSAGLLANIDIQKTPHVSHIWSFAGLNPTVKWEKGQVRPWNARLKVVCFHLGESFVKVSNKEGAFYGQLYSQRKEQEIAKNEAGLFSDQAERILKVKKIGKSTDAYKYYSKGFLPPAHIHARAKRWAVKIFLTHWHQVAYELQYGVSPPRPYIIEVIGHKDYIDPPNW